MRASTTRKSNRPGAKRLSQGEEADMNAFDNGHGERFLLAEG